MSTKPLLHPTRSSALVHPYPSRHLESFPHEVNPARQKANAQSDDGRCKDSHLRGERFGGVFPKMGSKTKAEVETPSQRWRPQRVACCICGGHIERTPETTIEAVKSQESLRIECEFELKDRRGLFEAGGSFPPAEAARWSSGVLETN